MTFNYQFKFSTTPCHCGSKKCTGFIGSGLEPVDKMEEMHAKSKKIVTKTKNGIKKIRMVKKVKRDPTIQINSVAAISETPDPMEDMVEAMMDEV